MNKSKQVIFIKEENTEGSQNNQDEEQEAAGGDEQIEDNEMRDNDQKRVYGNDEDSIMKEKHDHTI